MPNSYFYIDKNIVQAQCEKCFQKNQKGWLWRENMGYGEYDLYCSICNQLIHKGANEENKANS